MSRFSIVVILAFVSYASADTLESVEKTLIGKFEKCTSLSAKMKMTTKMAGMSSDSTGTMEFLRRDGKDMVRNEITAKMDMGGQTMESHVLMTFDGTDAHTVSETMGQTMAMKTNPSQVKGPSAGKEFFADLHRDNEVKLLPDETIDGSKVYVIEATPKKSNPQAPAVTKYYFDQDKGFMVKMLGLGADGKTMLSVIMSDVKINPKLDPSRFVFKAPPGVTVMDMSKM